MKEFLIYLKNMKIGDWLSLGVFFMGLIGLVFASQSLSPRDKFSAGSYLIITISGIRCLIKDKESQKLVYRINLFLTTIFLLYSLYHIKDILYLN